MNHRRRLTLLVMTALILSSCGEPEDTRPGRPVAHRHAAFVAILKAFEPMRERLHDGKYDPSEFAALAQRLDAVKDGPWPYFAPGTDYPPSHATARVWSEAPRFEAARKAFYDATQLLLATAGSGDVDKVTTSYELVHNTCLDCHKVFKKR
jgi:cytochrome c556